MSSEPFKSMKLILPGVFLLILGAGNISVGAFKGHQYQQVLEELSELEPTPGLVNASPMRRIQQAKITANRLYQRQLKAQNRRDFYGLVTFGGKVFIGLSLVFLFPGLLIRYRQVKKQTS